MSASPANVRSIRFERWPWETSPGLMVRFAVAVTTVFLLLAPYLANLSRDYTRYCSFWRTTDTLCVGLLLLGLAVLVTLAGELIRFAGRPIFVRIFNHLFLAAFGIGILANIKFAAPKIPYAHWHMTTAQLHAAWIVLALIVGYSFGNPRLRILMRCRQICQIVLPVVPITFVTLLLGSTYPVAVEPIVPIPQVCSASALEQDAPRGGIYVFLFDEWSYERTFSDGAVLARYSHLADFAKVATVYHQAYSPAPNTEASIPAILMQTGDIVEINNGRLGFLTADGTFRSSRDYTNLFDRLGILGYHTAMIGCAMPYRQWLGERVDLCRTYCLYPSGGDLTSRLGVHVYNAMRYSPDLWFNRQYKQLETRLLHRAYCGMFEHIRHDLRTIVSDWPSNTFVCTHILLPHMPAVLKPDLKYVEPQQMGRRDNDVSQYEANLAALDAWLGDFVVTLRQAGKYGDATIVLTSDHTWRTDPNWSKGVLTGPKTHVPLLVKAPRQYRPAFVDERFETKNLGELIASLVSAPGIGDVLVTKNRIR